MKNSSGIIGTILVYISIMGAVSPGFANKLPEYWKNNSTPQLIYSRTGHHVQILPNGTVRGTMEHELSEKNYVTMLLIPRAQEYGVASLVIQAIQTGRYLCMNELSLVYSTDKLNDKDCTWIEILLPNWYNAYKHRSHKKKRKHFYLAVNFDGTMQPGNISRKSRRTSQFLRQDVPNKGNGKNSLGLDHSPKSSVVAPTAHQTDKPKRKTKIGCKGLKTKYCRRMRKRMRKGKGITHAKRHRKCRNRRKERLKSKLSAKEFGRLVKQCKRIRRKRQERRRRKHRTSTLSAALGLRTTAQTPHRT